MLLIYTEFVWKLIHSAYLKIVLIFIKMEHGLFFNTFSTFYNETIIASLRKMCFFMYILKNTETF